MPRKKRVKTPEEIAAEEFVYDNHNIQEDWIKLQEFYKDLDVEMDKFLKKRSRRASVRARNKLIGIKHMALQIRHSIMFQRQDNDTNRYTED